MVNERAPPKGPQRPSNNREEPRPATGLIGKPNPSAGGADDLLARFDALRVSTTSKNNTNSQRAESPDVVEIPRPVSHSQKPATRPPPLPSNTARDDALKSFFSDKGRSDTFNSSSSTNTSTSRGHTFGHPTKMMSSLKQRAAGVFNERRSRPEHHRVDNNKHKIAVPSVPIHQDRKPDPLNLYSSIGPDANPSTFKPSGSYATEDFYTDPAKASADLKALLEGGIDEDKDQAPDSEAEKQDNGVVKKDGTVNGLRVKLLPHQVEGVEWMRGRELGPVKKGRVPKGGILADDMGLGKTLQTISLILGNQKPDKDDQGWKKSFGNIERTTLVVAPLALIRQWEAEIKDKVDKTHALKVCVHHGPQRTKNFKDLSRYDVVVTTYQVLVSEHGHSSDEENGVKAGCFGLHWWRVVLDEAHTIKNRNAKSTKACYALRSEYRWCLSGTPMQNSLDELQSLIKFLRIKPYDNLAEWKDQIEKPMKNGKGHVAIRRLHSILYCFMKRRTKAILKEDGALNPGGKPTQDGQPSAMGFKVTERKVVKVVSQFSPAERRFYDRMAARADESIERMEKGGMNYANALVLLLRLRQACNHPKLVAGKLEKDRDALSTDASQKTTEADIDDLADMFGGMGIVTRTCSICARNLPKNLPENHDMCQECFGDLAYFNEKETPKSKKPKTKRTKAKVVEKVRVESSPVQQKQRRPRNRNIIVDSDDEEEEEEEAGGKWLVPENERGQLRLGKAGGEEDENAEGGGDWLGTEDSVHKSEEEADGSRLSSFVVDDDRSAIKTRTEVDSDSDDSFASISVIASQIEQKKLEASQRSRSVSEEDDSSLTDDDTGIDESDVESSDDSRVFHSVGQASQILASAKIREMMQILHKEIYEHKFIVFSQFTSMMDLVEPFFRKEGFKYTRYDGSMKNDEREASLNRLRNDPNTRILLCSLKCGSLGLNLTAATRVIIVEPFWNPFIEEQAIDRVHRLTQTVDVIVYKLTVQETVEERILDLQEKKRLLAETAIEGGMKKDMLKLGFREIMDLFRRDGPPNSAARTDTGISSSRNSEVGNLSQVSDASSSTRTGAKARSKTKPSRAEDSVYGRRW